MASGAAMFVAAGALIFGLLQGGVAWAWWSVPSGLVLAVALAAAALAVVAALTIAGALLVMPRHFSTAAGETASTGPAEASMDEESPAGTSSPGRPAENRSDQPGLRC